MIADAEDLASRVEALSNAHPWMDAATRATVASQPLTVEQMLGQGETLRQNMASTYDGLTPRTYDPVQHQAQTTKAFAQNYLATTLGGNPYDTNSLSYMQDQLKKQGYGRDLVTNGMWDQDWQAALQAHVRDQFSQQQAGNNPKKLSTTSHGFLHGVLDAISLSGIASAVVGTVKSLPDDFRNLSADLLGDVATLGGTATYGLEQAVTGHGAEGIRASLRAGAGVGAAVTGALGGQNLSAQDYYTNRQDLGRVVNDVGTLAMITPGVGEAVGGGVRGLRALGKGSTLAEAQAGQGVITNTLGRTIGHEAAVRSPGMIAKAAGTQLGTHVLAGATIGGAAGGGLAAVQGRNIETGIGQGVALGAAGGVGLRLAERFSVAGTRVLPKKFAENDYLDNLPVLKQTGSLVDKLADADGQYYALRTRLARPYEYGAVRLAGSALAKGQAASLELHGLSWLENTVGDNPNTQPIARYIAGSHPLDPINDALKNLQFRADGLTFTPSLDWTMYVLHGSLERGLDFQQSAGTTGAVARRGQAINDAIENGLGNFGIRERIARGTGESWDSLVQHAGGDEHLLNEWAIDKTNHIAASHYATQILKNAPADVRAMVASNHQTGLDWMNNARAQAWDDPAVMRKAVADLTSAEHSNFIETYIKGERIAAASRWQEELRNSIANYTRAGRDMRDTLVPNSHQLLGPSTYDAIPAGISPELLENPTFVKRMKDAGLILTKQRPGPGPFADGALGIKRIGTLTSQMAQQHLKEFAAQAQPLLDTWDQLITRQRNFLSDEVEGAKATLSEEQKHQIIGEVNDGLNSLVRDLVDYARTQHGLDDRALRAFAGNDPRQTVNKLMSLLEDQRKNLASEVQLGPNAAPATRAAWQRVHDQGYMVVHGKDIGHVFRADIYRNLDLGKLATRQRQVAQSIGLGNERFAPRDLAATRRLNSTLAMAKEIDTNSRVVMPPGYTIRTMFNELSDPELLSKQLPGPQNVAFALGRRMHQRTLKALAEQYGESLDQAEARLKTDMASAAGVNGLRRKDWQAVFGRTDNIPWASGVDEGIPLMDSYTVDRLYSAFMRGQADTEIRQVGLTHLEDLARFLPFKLLRNERWDTDTIRAFAGVSNALVHARDQWRFALNPLFSIRKVVKSNMKMLADNVTPTVNPVRALQDSGAWNSAHTLLDTLHGAQSGHYQYLDDAERYLDQSDVFGIYNSRQYEAYYVHAKQQQGFSDADIRKGLIRTFGYGANGLEGRTAAERSLNVVFFPFSFEKTVVRNIGGYLLDHQAQALVLSNALSAYRQFSADHPDNPLAQTWIDAHLPILNEAYRLNAFAHGISAGEFGGINAPLLNLFLPQSWASNKDTAKALERFVPTVADAHRIYGEINDQNKIVIQSMKNGISRIEQQPGSPLNRLPSAETSAQQKIDAVGYRNDLVDAFRSVIDYNERQGSDAQKYHFGYNDNIPAKLQGAVIDKHNLALIVAHAYPAYDPSLGAGFAIIKRDNALAYIHSKHGTPMFAAYSDFYTKAETAIGHMNKDEYPVAQAAQAQEMFRAAARAFASRDPSFKTFYNKSFASAFGPLG